MNFFQLRIGAALMPYAMLPLVAVVWLTVHYVRSTEASVRSKRVVVCLTAASFVALVLTVHPLIFLFQIAICVYIILHRIVTDTGDEKSKAQARPAFHQVPPSDKSSPRDYSD